MVKVLTCHGCSKKKKCIKQGVFFNERCAFYTKKRVSISQHMTKDLDDLWSLCVRTRDNFTCRKCGRSKEMGYTIQAHHIIHKGNNNYGTRWVIENGISLCYHCHHHIAHHNSIEFENWIRDKVDYEALLIRKNNTVKDKAAVKIYLQNELKKYESSN